MDHSHLCKVGLCYPHTSAHNYVQRKCQVNVDVQLKTDISKLNDFGGYIWNI